MSVFEHINGDGYEQVVFCSDDRSGLRAIIAIHSTALGPALGGTRFYPYRNEEDALVDVLRLAKGMTYKAAAAGLDLGGGKAVIIGDPRRSKTEELLRAYGRFVGTLGGRYITAEDVGTALEDMDVVRRETRWVTGCSRTFGGSGDPSPVTAYGVLHGLKACALEVFGEGSSMGPLNDALKDYVRSRQSDIRYEQAVKIQRGPIHVRIHGDVAWTAATKWVAQALSWASWLIVARLLTPEDYGLVGMATIYLGLITLVSEFGLGTAVLAIRELSDEQIRQLHGLAALLGVAGLLASCALAIPLGRFFRAPDLPLVVVMMSATFVIASLRTVPLALLQRELRFKALAWIDLGQTLVLTVSMVGFAAAGFRYWTLVCGAVLGALVSTGAVLRLRRVRAYREEG